MLRLRTGSNGHPRFAEIDRKITVATRRIRELENQFDNYETLDEYLRVIRLRDELLDIRSRIMKEFMR